jgi:uncharacterized membrane protein (UPF0127 family)
MSFKKMIYPSLIVVFVLLALYSVFSSRNTEVQAIEYREHAQLKGVEMTLARVTTREQEKRGLSFQKSIGDSDGLLFIFEKPDRQGIWMKDMLFPIDVFWFDENFRVVYIKKNFTPDSYPLSVYPDTPALYVLETKAGFADEHGITLGDSLTFPGTAGLGAPVPL